MTSSIRGKEKVVLFSLSLLPLGLSVCGINFARVVLSFGQPPPRSKLKGLRKQLMRIVMAAYIERTPTDVPAGNTKL
jgi:hypothetical protein